MAIRPDGANLFDGTGSSSLNGLPPPRIALSATAAPTMTTMMTTSAKRMDRVPWMKVFLMTSSS
ncbi:Uncharacterised protein [Mycobacterium tuberculosis]|nr:Uncharacterised protein [Mycobacterium tuberculosis]